MDRQRKRAEKKGSICRHQQGRKSGPETASAIGAVSAPPDCLSPGAGLLSQKASRPNALISSALS